MSNEPTVRGYVVGPGEGVPDRTPDVKASGRSTGGSLTVMELAVDGGPPRHTHTREDESFYVFTGVVDVECGEDRFEAGPGSFVFLPRNLPHAFRSVGGPVTALLDRDLGRSGQLLRRAARDDAFERRSGRGQADPGRVRHRAVLTGRRASASESHLRRVSNAGRHGGRERAATPARRAAPGNGCAPAGDNDSARASSTGSAADARVFPLPPLGAPASPVRGVGGQALCRARLRPARPRGHPIRAAATSAPRASRRMRRCPCCDRGEVSASATARSVASQPWLSSSAVAAWIARSVALTAAGLFAAMLRAAGHLERVGHGTAGFAHRIQRAVLKGGVGTDGVAGEEQPDGHRLGHGTRARSSAPQLRLPGYV